MRHSVAILSICTSSAALSAAAAGSPLPAGSSSWDAVAPARSGVLLAAKKKKKKKKKKVEEDDSEFGMDSVDAIEDNDTGVGIHRGQEGVDTPYTAELAGATEVASLTTKNGSDPTDSIYVNADGHICLRFGRIFAGPDLGIKYESKTAKSEDATTGAGIEDKSKVTTVRVGPLVRLYFGNPDTAEDLPFVYVGAAYKRQASETKLGSAATAKLTMSGYEAKLGGGLAIFMDSNVSLAPKAEYYLDSLSGKPEGATAEVKSATSGVRLLLELMTFL